MILHPLRGELPKTGGNARPQVGMLIAQGLLALCLAVAPAGWARAAGAVDFDHQVRPILFSRCVGCHGADTAEAGLRLDSRAAATGQLDSVAAIVPQRPEESELLRRVASSDPDERMPPEGEPLTDAEIERLRRWINDGAPWPEHWAYRPLVKPLPPVITSAEMAGWAASPIDAFVAEKLLDNDLRPSPAADRRTLLRRVHFDLLGLPPPPEMLDAFIADRSPDAYERIVDSLLASPQYGERWARHWMDLVHFAESHGHDQDRPREHAWPYRDYLIRAFNIDQPYQRFVQEQVAGDALFPDDPWAIVATGFLAAGPWDESSLRDIQADSLDRQIGHYLDRDDIVTTTLSTFISTTVHCARCHDHKFDPITQQEYYNLQAVFAGTDKANRTYDPDPHVARQRREILAALEQLEQQRGRSDSELLLPRMQAEVAQWEQQWQQTAAQWQVLEPAAFSSEHGSVLNLQPDHSLLAQGFRPDKDTYTVEASCDLSELTAIRLEVMADPSLPHNGPGRQDNGNLHLNEFRVTATPTTAAPAAQSPGTVPLEWGGVSADFDQEGWTAAHAIDGNPATAWGIFPQIGQTHTATFALKEKLAGPVRLRATLQQSHGQGHLIGRLRLSVTGSPAPLEAAALPPAVASILQTQPELRSPSERIELVAFVLGQRLQRDLAALPPQQRVYCGTNQFEPDGSFQSAAQPRTVQVLQRGEIGRPLGEATPGALALVSQLSPAFELPQPQDEAARRAALARWLSDRQNVLTWRSIANRLWQFHFGQGIVDTPNDFGHMGSAPTHPELLDWLAVELRDNGGSLKSLQRLIVTSAAYRQQSDYASPRAEQDTDNRFLWRMNRRRLDAESVRDAALQISGMLDRKMGGPSVRQFLQTPGVHVTPVVDYANFDVDSPAMSRCSVYRFLFRTVPDPFLQSLDCPDGSQLTPQRTESLTALHALSLLNDKLLVRLSQRIAARAEREAQAGESAVAVAFRLILLRLPSADEAAAVARYAEEHGLANACRYLLNTNEFMFVD